MASNIIPYIEHSSIIYKSSRSLNSALALFKANTNKAARIA